MLYCATLLLEMLLLEYNWLYHRLLNGLAAL